MPKSGPGFVKLYHAMLERMDLLPQDKLVCAVLLDQIFWKKGVAEMGQRLLASKTGLSRGAVARAIGRLVEGGFIEPDRGVGRGRYRCGPVAHQWATSSKEGGPSVDQARPTSGPAVAHPWARSGPPVSQGKDCQTLSRLFPDNGAPAKKPPAKKRAKKPKPRKSREPDPIWDAVAAEWFAAGVATSQRTRLGKLVRDLKDMGATPAGIRTARAAYRKEWPDAADTPEAIVKHWSRFASAASPKQPGQDFAYLTAHPPLLALANRWPAEVQANAKAWRLIAELLVETHQWAVDEDVAKLATQAKSEEQARHDCLERLRQTTAYQRRQGRRPGESGASPDPGPDQSPPRESAGPRPAVRAVT